MASTNDFLVQLLAKLDTSSVNTEFEALKKRLANDPVIQKVTLDTSMSKQAIRSMASEIHNELGKAFKATGIESFDITVKDVESILASAVRESNKLAKELDIASSKAQKFLAQFNNKSGGTLVNSAEFKAVQDAINGLGNTHTIDDLNKAMNTLETTYNNMVSSLRNSGKSLNPFINAKNEMATMDDTIKGIGLEFEKLANKPKSVSDAIKQLSVQQANVNSHTIGTQEWADAYGKLQQMIQKVKSEISNLQKAQSANVSTQIFNTADLDKQGKVYIQKVRNTIEAIKPELESKLRSAGYTDIEIKGVEKANGQIKSLTATVTDATGAFKQLNFQREKIQGKGKAQMGFVQTDDVKVIGTLSSSVEKVQGNLTTLKSKWEEQGVLVGEFKTKVEQLETSLASVGSKGELNGLKTQIETLKTEASQLADVNKIQLSFDTGAYDAKVQSLIGRTNQWVDANGYARISTDALRSALDNLNKAYANVAASGGNTIANQQALIAAEKALDVEVKKVQSSVTSMNAQFMKSSAVDSLRQKVQQFYDTNTATHRLWGKDLKNIMAQLGSGMQVPISEGKKLEQQFYAIQNSARVAGKLGLSWFDKLKEGMKSFSYWTSSTFLVMKVITEIKQAVATIKEIDIAMMDLTMATGYNKTQVEELMDTYYKLGEQLGATATDVAASADTWLRQGKSIAETNKLIEDSMILSKISGLSAEESTKYLTSAMKGYKVATEDVLGIVDKLSAVDMASATDVGGLAEGMSQVAASAQLAGVSMDKLLGYLASVGEVTQEGMSSVGTAYNAIFSRMGNIKLSRLKDYETGEDLSNVETVLRGVGIQLRDSESSFRDFDEVLDETASRWSTFSEVQQRAIANAFAGTHHVDSFITLMLNYDKALEYTEKSMNSNGQAMEKFAAYEDTIAYHTGQFEIAYQKMSETLLNSGLVKFFVDAGTAGVKFITQLGSLGTIGLGAGLFAGIKNVG